MFAHCWNSNLSLNQQLSGGFFKDFSHNYYCLSIKFIFIVMKEFKGKSFASHILNFTFLGAHYLLVHL